LLLARLDFHIGFEMMIAYLFQTDCGGRAAKNRKFLSQLAFFMDEPLTKTFCRRRVVSGDERDDLPNLAALAARDLLCSRLRLQRKRITVTCGQKIVAPMLDQ
jgi:hypothetical protein